MIISKILIMKGSRAVVSLLLTIAMLFSLLASEATIVSAFSSHLEISVERIEAHPGSNNNEVKVFIPNGWAAFSFSVKFDPNNLFFKSFTFNKAIREQMSSGAPNVCVVNNADAYKGEVIIAFASAIVNDGQEGYYNVDNAGNAYDYLGTLSFDVASGASGFQPITLKAEKLVDTNSYDISCSVENGGIDVIAASEHDWEVISETPATCTEAGKRVYHCSECGQEKEEIIPKDPSAHDWIEIGCSPASCTTKGFIDYACSYNPQHVKRENVPASGHAWSEWEVIKPNTYKSTGEEARLCTVCWAAETRVIPVAKLQSVSVSKLPYKTSYIEMAGTFEIDGAELTLNYDNKTYRTAKILDYNKVYKLVFDDGGEAENCIVRGFNNAVVGYQSVTVTYAGKSASFAIEIRAKSVTGIDIIVAPTKTEYELGESLDLNGTVLKIYYDNNTEQTANVMSVAGFHRVILKGSSVSSDIAVRGFDSGTKGFKAVTLEYSDHTDSFTVNCGGAKKCDLDNDYEITVADALAALRIAAKLEESTPGFIACCDTDGDGHITVADALAILRVAAKLADSL